MNWYKKAQGIKVTPNTGFETRIMITVKEILAIDEFVDHGTHERTAKEILLRIIRENPSIIRMHSEGLI